ncbi:hypothetical protein RFI_08539, partial [Reticulomyxa filosa]
VMNKDPSVVTQLRATLPRNAYGTYYVDRIGNISTSHFRQGPKQSYLEIKPRYPLYGGWKTDFTIGYGVPSQDLITFDTDTYVHTLNLSFGIPFREPVTDLLTTKIALPEGAYDVQIDCPFEIDQEPISRRYTYLDTGLFGGRPLITFHKHNVISLHDEYYQVRYKYDHLRVYYKLILLVGGFFLFFLFIIVILRINPSLDRFFFSCRCYLYASFNFLKKKGGAGRGPKKKRGGDFVFENSPNTKGNVARTSKCNSAVPSTEQPKDAKDTKDTKDTKDAKAILASISRNDPVESIIQKLREAQNASKDTPLANRLKKEIKKFRKDANDKKKIGDLVDALTKLQ